MDDNISTAAIDLDAYEKVSIVAEHSGIVYNGKEATESLTLRISKIDRECS